MEKGDRRKRERGGKGREERDAPGGQLTCSGRIAKRRMFRRQGAGKRAAKPGGTPSGRLFLCLALGKGRLGAAGGFLREPLLGCLWGEEGALRRRCGRKTPGGGAAKARVMGTWRAGENVCPPPEPDGGNAGAGAGPLLQPQGQRRDGSRGKGSAGEGRGRRGLRGGKKPRPVRPKGASPDGVGGMGREGYLRRSASRALRVSCFLWNIS